MPTIIRAGKAKTIADEVPPVEAKVCTAVFSRIFEFLNRLNTAIDITAAGNVVEKVKPTFSARYIFAAININVINAAKRQALIVSSGSFCDAGIKLFNLFSKIIVFVKKKFKYGLNCI